MFRSWDKPAVTRWGALEVLGVCDCAGKEHDAWLWAAGCIRPRTGTEVVLMQVILSLNF